MGSQTPESDKFHPIVAHHAQQIANEKGYVSPIDVFLALGKLSPEQHEAWRRCQVPYLEQILSGNLNKLKRINRCLRRWALSLGLKPSKTVYKSWGKGQKINLRFSKSGDPSIERAYSTHYVDVELLRQRGSNRTGGSAMVDSSKQKGGNKEHKRSNLR